jgi:hypothetical protein
MYAHLFEPWTVTKTEERRIRTKLLTYPYWCELHVYHSLRQDCERLTLEILPLSSRVDHSCETGWNKHGSFYYSKQNSKFYHRVEC